MNSTFQGGAAWPGPAATVDRIQAARLLIARAQDVDDVLRDLYAEIMALRWERDDLRELVEELAEDLGCEVEHRYHSTKDHPAMAWRYERDMEPVHRARATLNPRAALTPDKEPSENVALDAPSAPPEPS